MSAAGHCEGLASDLTLVLVIPRPTFCLYAVHLLPSGDTGKGAENHWEICDFHKSHLNSVLR